MKKIFSILLLFACSFAHSQIGQFSPIWTYTGSNIQYTNGSTNTSSLNVNGPETVTGTFSVGSTATLSGNAYMGQNASNTTTLGGVSMGYNTSSGIMHFGKYSATSNAIWGYHSSTPTTSNYNLNFDANNAYFNSPNALFLVTNGTIRASYGTSSSYNTLPLRIGSNSAPTATLDVTGDAKVSSTFSLGSANLTGGNTGTVAVLSDVISHIDNYVISSAIADNQTYYFSHIPFGITTLNAKLKVSGDWTIYQYQFEAWCNGTTSSAETCTLNYQVGTTTTTIRSDVTFTFSGANTYTGTLNVNLNDGDLFNSQLITPNFPTNPTNVGINMTYWIRRRS